jgi:hypothetical protein
MTKINANRYFRGVFIRHLFRRQKRKSKGKWLGHFMRGMKNSLDGISNGGYENK